MQHNSKPSPPNQDSKEATTEFIITGKPDYILKESAIALKCPELEQTNGNDGALSLDSAMVYRFSPDKSNAASKSLTANEVKLQSNQNQVQSMSQQCRQNMEGLIRMIDGICEQTGTAGSEKRKAMDIFSTNLDNISAKIDDENQSEDMQQGSSSHSELSGRLFKRKGKFNLIDFKAQENFEKIESTGQSELVSNFETND